jgi:hypothetical protein
VGPAAVIDDLSQGALSIHVTNLTGQTVSQTGLNPADVLGGARSVYAGSLTQATAVVDTSAAQFRFSSDSSFGYFTLTEGETSSPFGTDLTADGSDAFAIHVAQLTFKPSAGIYDFEVETSGSWHTYDFLSNIAGINGSGTLTIPFSSFAGVDMRNVQAVRIDVARFQPSSQIVIGSITTVPEPSSLALFAAVLAVLPFIRKWIDRYNDSMRMNCRYAVKLRMDSGRTLPASRRSI